MWYIQALIMIPILWGLFGLFPTIGMFLDSTNEKEKHGDMIFGLCWSGFWLIIVSAICLGYCYAGYRQSIDENTKFIRVYEQAVVPCITQDIENGYIVSCNVAYQLENYGYTIDSFNSEYRQLKRDGKDWFEKYSSVPLPEYIKSIIVEDNCSCY